jgi:putative ABC transport system permease protein
VAIPLGMAFSRGIVDLLLHTAFVNETFQIPGTIAPRTYAIAAGVVAAAAAASSYVIRRQIDRLDLVSVLKTRE